MPGQLCGGLFAIAALSALAACASSSTPPVKQASNLQNGYKRVERNGEVYLCRQEKVTGTLTRKVETCLTEAQMNARSRAEQDEIRRGQGVPVQPAGANATGR